MYHVIALCNKITTPSILVELCGERLISDEDSSNCFIVLQTACNRVNLFSIVFFRHNIYTHMKITKKVILFLYKFAIWAENINTENDNYGSAQCNKRCATPSGGQG